MVKKYTCNRLISLLLIVMLLLALFPTMAVPASAAENSGLGYLEFYNASYSTFPMEPAFDPTHTSYTVIVPDYQTSLFFYAETIDASHTLKYAGPDGVIKYADQPGGPTYYETELPIPNPPEPITYTLYVGPGDTKTCVDEDIKYTVKIVSQLYLSGLSISNTLKPEFRAKTFKYSADVPEMAATTSITASAPDGYTIKINGEEAESGVPKSVTIKWSGDTMEIPIVVNYDGMETIPATYTLTLHKKAVTATPEILTQPQSATYLDKQTAKPLSVEAVCSGTIAYQWYESTDDVTFTPIDGAVSPEFTPVISEVTDTTKRYYHCVVVNSSSGSNETVTSDTATVTVNVDPTPQNISLLLEGIGDFPEEGLIYAKGEAAAALTINPTTRISGGTMEFNLSIYDSKDATVRRDGRTTTITNYQPGLSANPAFTIPTGTVGTFYYDIQLVYYIQHSADSPYTVYRSSVSERIGPVTVYPTDAEAPAIYRQPKSAVYILNKDTVAALSVAASVTDGGTLSYQWYEKINEGEYNKIDGATNANYTPSVPAVSGKAHYYCEITNTVTFEGNTYTAKTDSAAATLTYQNEDDAWVGNGTKDNPYLLEDIDDLIQLRDNVNLGVDTYSGKYFKLAADITLSSDWTPIGAIRTGVAENNTGFGKNIWPFSGILDGGGHTLTYRDGSRPLIGFARGATVQNLNLAGTYIDGCGLVESYFVDYGPTGNYGDWAAAGIGTIDIINVTIKSGLTIKNSGFIGGYSSGINHVNIIGCTVETGVRIGCDREGTPTGSSVGSFAGDFNGTVVDSVSYAAVYGVNNVGGLIGAKGQSMGSCTITNSAFHGTITASGNYVGGILGGGYNASDAPNTPCVSVENCYVTGTITGGNYVGGILGGEGGSRQAWDNGIGYIRNNYFAGTIVSSGANVGGVIGYMNSLNRYNIISNNYYLEGRGVAKGIGGVNIIDTSYPSPAAVSGVWYINTSIDDPSDLGPDNNAIGSAKRYHDRSDDPLGADVDRLTMSVTAEQLSNEVVGWLNAGEGSLGNWMQGTEGYPVHDSSTVTVLSISLSGNYKTDYYVNDPADYTGLVIDVVFSDGSTDRLNWNSDGVTFYGFDSSTEDPRMITVSYRGARAMYAVNVASKPGESTTPGRPGKSGEPTALGQSGEPTITQTAGTGGKGQTTKTGSSTTDAVQQGILEKIRNTPEGGTLTIQPGEEFKLTPDILSALKAKDMTVVVNRGDCSMSFHTSQITGTLKEGQEINFNVSSALENADKIEKAFGGESIQLLHFDYHGELPVPVTVRIKISDELAGKTPLYLYYYNQDSGRLEQLDTEVLIEDGYAQFDITHCSDYVLSDVSLKTEDDSKEEVKKSEILPISEKISWNWELAVGAAAVLAAAAIGTGIAYKRKRAK